MASASSISRLHREPAPAPKPECEQVKNPNSGNLEIGVPALPLPERPMRTRFARPHQAYELDAPQLMSILHSGVPVDHSHDFALLAAKEKVAQWAARQVKHGGVGGAHQYGHVAIQT